MDTWALIEGLMLGHRNWLGPQQLPATKSICFLIWTCFWGVGINSESLSGSSSPAPSDILIVCTLFLRFCFVNCFPRTYCDFFVLPLIKTPRHLLHLQLDMFDFGHADFSLIPQWVGGGRTLIWLISVSRDGSTRSTTILTHVIGNGQTEATSPSGIRSQLAPLFV